MRKNNKVPEEHQRFYEVEYSCGCVSTLAPAKKAKEKCPRHGFNAKVVRSGYLKVQEPKELDPKTVREVLPRSMRKGDIVNISGIAAAELDKIVEKTGMSKRAVVEYLIQRELEEGSPLNENLV